MSDICESCGFDHCACEYGGTGKDYEIALLQAQNENLKDAYRHLQTSLTYKTLELNNLKMANTKLEREINSLKDLSQ